jgi:dolichol-phosphate mannosyltransferase
VGQTPQGWTSLMIVVTVMGSVQLFVLGIMGQYLGRIHEQSQGRPLFIVDRVFRFENDKAIRAEEEVASKSAKTTEILAKDK